MIHSTFRGHATVCINGVWYYADTMQPTIETWRERPCGHCGLHNTPEGHDGCLGTLPGVRNACCGHGEDNEAYIQYHDWSTVRGAEARARMPRLPQPTGEE